MRVHLGLQTAGHVAATAPSRGVPPPPQTEFTSQTEGMRLTRAPAMTTSVALLTLALFTLPSASLASKQHTQLYFICKKPDSSLCTSLVIKPENNINELYARKDLTYHCGLSELKPVPPHRKFIKVKPLNRSSKIIFCKISKIITVAELDSAFILKSIHGIHRVRRQVGYTPRGRYRGQTQSQYLTIDHGNGDDEGKAEAQSTADTSRAVVSGKSGMGQAQSQTIYDATCDECVGGSKPGVESSKQRPEAQNIPNVGGSIGASGSPGSSGSYLSHNQGGNGNFGPNGLSSIGNNGPQRYPSGTGNQPQLGPNEMGSYIPHGTTSNSGSFEPPNNLGIGKNYIPQGPSESSGFGSGPGFMGSYGTQGDPSRTTNIGPQNTPGETSKIGGILSSPSVPGTAGSYIPQSSSSGNENNSPQNGQSGVGNYLLPRTPVSNQGEGTINDLPQGTVNGNGNYGSPINPPGNIAYNPMSGSGIYDSNGVPSVAGYGPQQGVKDNSIYQPGHTIRDGVYNQQQPMVPSIGSGTYRPQRIPENNMIYTHQGGIGDNSAYGSPNNIASYRPQGSTGTNPAYYCCVLGPNNSLQYVGPGNIKTPEFMRQPFNRIDGQQPNIIYGTGVSTNIPGTNQFTSGQGGLVIPNAYNTGTLSGPTPSVSYGIGPGQISAGPYGAGTNNGQTPNVYGTGDNNRVSSSGPYDVGGLNRQIPSTGTYGIRGNNGQSPGSYSPRNIGGEISTNPFNAGIPNGQTSTNQYGPGVNGELPQISTYGTGMINGGTPSNIYNIRGGKTPVGPYGTGTIGGTNGVGPTNVQNLPSLYNSGSNGGQPNLYNNENSRPGGGSVVSGQAPDGSYGGGISNGQMALGSYDPRINGQQTPNNPFTTGINTYGASPPGAYNRQIPVGLYGNKGGNGFYGSPQESGLNSQQPIHGPYGAGPGSNNGEYGNTETMLGKDNNGVPQNVVDPNSIVTSIDGDDSQALASVDQNANGTTASASSKGGNEKSRAQTQVQGTYTGSGSFSAQAQINEENKGAESEVKGGKEGASSKAQGRGRSNQSQAGVRLGSETGAIETEAQSSGSAHSSNSNVQGSVKGGMADAQAKGPGSTSSQAQIGFTPYKDADRALHDSHKIPFVGKGTASAQSSGRTGQSQSQLEGTFKYGITYNGAAQAGASLDKDAVFTNRLPFNKIDVFDESNKNINVETEKTIEDTTLPEITTDKQVANETYEEESLRKSESRYSAHSHSDHHKVNNEQYTTENPSTVTSKRSFQHTYSNDYEYTTDKDASPPEDYDGDGGFGPEVNEGTEMEQGEYPNYDEFSKDHDTHQSLRNPSRKGLEIKQTTGSNTQHIVLGSLDGHDAEITQRNSEQNLNEGKIYQPGESVPGTAGYTIPIGFTGSVKSVASKDKTYATGFRDSPSQAQTVTLTPGTGKLKYIYPKQTYLHGKNVKPKNLRSLYNPKTDENNRYISVSKSVTGALDGDNNIKKQYSHTYYTKSSSCGYFTFTCTMVSGTNGRKKVCKPKIPTNPDGTPMRC